MKGLECISIPQARRAMEGYKYEMGEPSIVEEVEAYVMKVSEDMERVALEEHRKKMEMRMKNKVKTMRGTNVKEESGKDEKKAESGSNDDAKLDGSNNQNTKANDKSKDTEVYDEDEDYDTHEDDLQDPNEELLDISKLHLPFQVPHFTGTDSDVGWGWSGAVPYVPDEVLKVLDQESMEMLGDGWDGGLDDIDEL
jgi:hypothetical protein